MAGLGLTQALDEYQQGLAWKQQQDARATALAKQQEQEARLAEANKAAMDVIERSRAEWAINGAQGEYAPNDATMFKAAEARSRAFARAGDWDNLVKNEAAVQGLRIKARSQALQRYGADGDFEAAFRAIYPSLFDGEEVVGLEKQAEHDPQGLQASKTTYRAKMASGKTVTIDPQQFIATAKQTLIDPATYGAEEIKANLRMAIDKHHAEQQRATEAARHGHRVKEIEARGDAKLDEVDARGEVQRDVAGIGAESRERAAKTRADGTVRAAEVRAGAAGLGGASGGRAGGQRRVSKTDTDAEGYKIAIFSDGTTERLKVEGKPVRSGDWAKRVDRLADNLSKRVGNLGKTPEELRAQAEKILMGQEKLPEAAPAPAAPGLSSASPPASGGTRDMLAPWRR